MVGRLFKGFVYVRLDQQLTSSATMRSTLILLSMLALVSSIVAAPTPSKWCGWKPHDEKPDTVPDPARINERAVPNAKTTINPPKMINC